MGTLETLKKSFRDNRFFLGVASLGFLGSIITAFCFGAKLSEMVFFLPSVASSFAFVFVMFALCVVTLYPRIWWKTKNWKTTKTEIDSIMRDYFEGGRFTQALPVFLAVLMMLLMVAVIKSLIQYINPYHLDPLFAQWDYDLHFGAYPQYWLAPIIEKLSLVPFLNYAYNIWFGVMLGSLWYATFLDKDPVRRKRFLWSSLLGWLLIGWVGATALSSVGPIFFAQFYPDLTDPYADYITHLKDIDATMTPLATLWVSDLLYKMSQDMAVIDLNGISAMPSMHVAIATLSALYLWQVNRLWGIAAALFVVVIETGSVYLGWHYAIDGYASAIMIVVIWFLTGVVIKRRNNK